ncbi:ArgS-related anticodon-binding protein NrtL [Streptomyces sp. NPDC001834]|uniref:ArgS-related anticodon-binding protein NrtL n=1 Tax=unclassified Streptomyces TaxID=2593676 RepID=UPI003432D568
MTPADLSRAVLHAVRRAVDENALRAPVPARVRVERTRPGGRGDYACAVALQLARPAALPARDVAEIIRERVRGVPGIGTVEVTGPGFLNFSLPGGADRLGALVRDIGTGGSEYGYGHALAGTTVSFAPVEEARARVVTEVVERLLRAQGATVGARAAGGEALHVMPVPAADRDLFARLGNDAARWALLRAAPHDRPQDTGSDALLAQREGNPLFRVRYAYARTRALSRNARQLGFTAAYHANERLGFTSAYDAHEEGVGTGCEKSSRERPAFPAATGDAYEEGPGLGCGEAVARTRLPSGDACEGPGDSIRPASADRAGAVTDALVALLADHPGVLAAAARHREPDRVARQLEAIARAFFDFHDGAPPLPVGDEKPSAAHRSRLALAEAAGTVLAGGLSLLGISAPEVL